VDIDARIVCFPKPSGRGPRSDVHYAIVEWLVAFWNRSSMRTSAVASFCDASLKVWRHCRKLDCRSDIARRKTKVRSHSSCCVVCYLSFQISFVCFSCRKRNNNEHVADARQSTLDKHFVVYSTRSSPPPQQRQQQQQREHSSISSSSSLTATTTRSTNNNTSFIPPVYLQHQGHSRTIIGYERKIDGMYNLLILDPSSTNLENAIRSSNLSMLRRSVESLNKPQYGRFFFFFCDH
jgi:hypothetical protein